MTTMERSLWALVAFLTSSPPWAYTNKDGSLWFGISVSNQNPSISNKLSDSISHCHQKDSLFHVAWGRAVAASGQLLDTHTPPAPGKAGLQRGDAHPLVPSRQRRSCTCPHRAEIQVRRHCPFAMGNPQQLAISITL